MRILQHFVSVLIAEKIRANMIRKGLGRDNERNRLN